MAEARPQSICAAVLAASGASEIVAREFGVPTKALVSVGGEAVVRRVVKALKRSGSVREVCVVAGKGSPVREAVADLACVVEAPGPEILDTLGAALGAFPGEERVLLVTCDLPLLSPAAVDDFVGHALATDAELTYVIVTKQLMEAYSQRKCLCVPLRDGEYTGGNLFCVSPSFVARERTRIMNVFAARKSNMAMAKLLGLPFVIGFLLRRHRLADVVNHAQRLLNCRVLVVNSEFTEVAFDIDKPEEVQLAAAKLSSAS
jgi:GTP:adenosylcobinamide-phosphate guanylyltransferase